MKCYKHTVTDSYKFKWEFYARDINNQNVINDLTKYSVKTEQAEMTDFMKYILICNFSRKKFIFHAIWIILSVLLYSGNSLLNRTSNYYLNICIVLLLINFIKDVLIYLYILLSSLHDYFSSEVTILLSRKA